MIVVGFLLFGVCLRASAGVTSDVEYLKRESGSLKLDVSVPDGDGPFPIAILLHGGGNNGNKQSYVTPLFSPLSTANFTWFTLDFRPVKEGIAAGVADIEAAIRWIKANAATYRGDPRRLALIGESTGGIFACVVAGRAEPGATVDAVVAFYTPADLEYIMPKGRMGPRSREYWGVKESDDLAALMREGSPISYAKPGMPQVLLIHGSADPKVPHANSVRLERAFKAVGVPCELITVEGGDHGMGSWETVDPTYKQRMVTWLQKTLGQR
ncbi:MAG TPA: alpha/beta hydrolase [Opitutaceae bacterium]|nr:alpha/beta hydrolase [Opitutaceae bacterium]